MAINFQSHYHHHMAFKKISCTMKIVRGQERERERFKRAWAGITALRWARYLITEKQNVALTQ